jgi:hypothetical protein
MIPQDSNDQSILSTNKIGPDIFGSSSLMTGVNKMHMHVCGSVWINQG